MTKARGRRFGLTVGVAFVTLAGLLWWRDHSPAAIVAASIGGLLLLAGVVVPTRLGPVEGAWMGLAHAISKVMMPLVMGLVYFLVLAPIGLAMRLFGRNPLVRGAARGGYWVSRQAERGQRGGMHHQF